MPKDHVGNYSIIDQQNGFVGEAYAVTPDGREVDAKANAQLWAAADVLLEACESARDEIALCLDDDAAWGWPGNLASALRKLRIAIEKARGETPS